MGLEAGETETRPKTLSDKPSTSHPHSETLHPQSLPVTAPKPPGMPYAQTFDAANQKSIKP